MPPQPSSNRGLFVSLGAVVVLVVLVWLGSTFHERKKASAAGEDTRQPMQRASATPAPTPPPQEIKPAEPIAPPEPAKPAQEDHGEER